MAEVKVKLREDVKITTSYKKNGVVQQEYVEREVAVPRGSLKHRRAEALKKLQEQVDSLAISPAFGNALAKVVKDPEGRMVCKKPRWFIKPYPAEIEFKRSAKTAWNELKLVAEMATCPEKFALDTQHQKSEVSAKGRELMWDFPILWPKEALQFEPLRKHLAKSTRHMKIWYEKYTGKECTLGKDELVEFIESEAAKHRPKLESSERPQGGSRSSSKG